MPRWWRDWCRGYSDLDMEMLRLKISTGMSPRQAHLTERERNALADMPKHELIRLAMEALHA